MTVFLNHLIEEHHRLFKDLYPQNNLIPKYHFMIHYPESICQIGPLVHKGEWDKHKFFRSSLKNFKNITKFLAKKHQIAVAYHWESLSSKGIESVPIKLKKLTDVENGDLISEHFQIDMSSEVSVTTWVKHNDIENHTGVVVCTDFTDELPEFHKIVCIFLRSLFFVTEIETTFVKFSCFSCY